MKPDVPRRQLLIMAILMLLVGGGYAFWMPGADADDPPGQSIAEGLGLPTFKGPGGKPVKFTAAFSQVAGKSRVQLRVTARIAPGNHLYSVTQKPGGPLATKITLASSTKLKLAGAWTPDKKPKIKESDIFDVPIEEHHGTVTWTAPFEIPVGVSAKTLKLQVKISGQACTDDLASCVQVNEMVAAVYQASGKPPAPKRSVVVAETAPVAVAQAENPFGADSFGADPAAYKDEFGHLTVEGQASPQVVAPGSTIRLSFKLTPVAPFHVYDYAAQDPGNSFKPTLLVVKAADGWLVTGPETDGIPVPTEDVDGNPLVYYEEPVTWTLTVKVPADAKLGSYDLTGSVGYQVCREEICDPPSAVDYSVSVMVAAETQEETAALVMKAGDYAKTNQAALAMINGSAVPGNEPGEESQGTDPVVGTGFDLGKLQQSGDSDESSLITILMIAFLAGFILNFMPCVLPVIGLKIVSFVQQAGESRQRVFMLNLWFSIGLISVFLVLATMAKVMGLGWGDQFRSLPFNVALTAIVFVFALSFLGIWEIPIPGFVASGKASEAAEQEGPAGAFCKGVLTTVLATPCSGPLLVPALAWAVAQPVLVTYLGFLCVGLGMAFPYLLIGANPQLIRFLPKPGAWMETFKNIMGFVLLATVVFLMTIISSISIPAVLPVFAFLIGLWAACWWVGKTPLTAEFSQQAKAWCGGLVVAACSGWISFGLLDGMMSARYEGQAVRDVEHFKELAKTRAKENKDKDDHELDWQPFSSELLAKLTSENKSVFVDFTADW
jgi:thiol:disulfide interchange protein